jgi:hypothetical protein
MYENVITAKGFHGNQVANGRRKRFGKRVDGTHPTASYENTRVSDKRYGTRDFRHTHI